MAEITASFPEALAGNRGTILWETVTCGDTGDSFELLDFVNNTVTVTGTFNSETLTLQGSNDDSNWFSLTDSQGDAIALTAAGMADILQAPRYIRPSFSGATGGDVDVIVQLRKNR